MTVCGEVESEITTMLQDKSALFSWHRQQALFQPIYDSLNAVMFKHQNRCAQLLNYKTAFLEFDRSIVIMQCRSEGIDTGS